MSERRERTRSKNRTIAYAAAIVVHALVIGALLVNFTSKPKSVDANFAEKVDVVNARTVPESQIQQQQDKLKQQERERLRKKEQERKRLEQLKKQAKEQEQNIEKLKEQQKVEKEKAQELEAERKAIALKKQQEDEKRKKDEAERKRKAEVAAKKKKEEQRIAKEKKELEDKRQAEQERIRKEEQELEATRQMNESIAREEALIAGELAKQRAATLQSKYAALIKQKVTRYRTISPDFERWRTATMNVKLSSSGEVQTVRIVKSSGNERYDRSVETAIYQASPLPIPSVTEDSAVNTIFRDLTLNFDMTGL